MKLRIASLPAVSFRNRLALIVTVGLARSALCEPIGQDDKTKPSESAKVEVITNSIGMKLALIPAGKFTMGSPRSEMERREKERAHEVSITKPFFIGVYEVTQSQLRAVLGADGSKSHFRESKGGSPEHPAENVQWKDAVDFCRKLSDLPQERAAGRKYRLPTEAEWEYACRGGTSTAFCFGNSLTSRQANFNGEYPYRSEKKGTYLRRTAKVGSYEPNAFGLYDMHGNVAEWCSDFYDPNYYAKSPKTDPKGPEEGAVSDDYKHFYRVVRGGSWLDDARACRSACRFRAMHRNRYWLIGFRIVCETKAKNKQD